MTPRAPQVTALGRADLDDAALVLGRAFRDNPGYRCALVGLTDEEREPVVRRIVRSMTRACLGAGEAWAARSDEGKLGGVSLCYPPGAYPFSFLTWLRSGMGAFSFSPTRTARLARIDAFMRRHHLRAPHHYLYVLGTDPPLQGLGYGGALLRHLCARADSDGATCYLETDAENNLALYRRFGFEVVHEGEVAGLDGLVMWTMTRPGSRAR